MGTLFTSIGKILNIRFLLILLTIVLFIDLYFTFHLHDSFWQNYSNYFNLKSIVTLIILYLVTVNVVVPMIGLMLSFFGFFISLVIHLSNIKFLENIADFLGNNDLLELEDMKDSAINKNNSALMKSYELKLEEYKEMHSIYLFSFFLTLELMLNIFNSSDISKTFIFEIYDYLHFNKTEDKETIYDIFLLYIPTGMLCLFSIRYITSFNILKIDQWVKFLKNLNK